MRHYTVKSGAFLIALTALDREIDCLCHAASNTIIICARRETIETDLLLTGRCDQIAVGV